jgi:hypothetical protein
MNATLNLKQFEAVENLVDEAVVLKNSAASVLEIWDKIPMPTVAQCDECITAVQVLDTVTSDMLDAIGKMIETEQDMPVMLKRQLQMLGGHMIEMKALLGFQKVMLTIDRMASSERAQIDFGMARPATATVH